jgi:hypothetical protein
LHSFGLVLVKRKLYGKKFLKKSKMAAGIKISLSRHLGFFEKLFSQNLRLSIK